MIILLILACTALLFGWIAVEILTAGSKVRIMEHNRKASEARIRAIASEVAKEWAKQNR